MHPTGQINQETPARLNIVAWPDPAVEAHGHKPGSPYIEAVWLGALGPSTTLCWKRLALLAAAARPAAAIDAVDLAVSLGLGGNLGRNAPISRTLGRMVSFGAARREGDTLAVRRALPDVPPRLAGRLSLTARLAHQHLAAQAAVRPSIQHEAPAMQVGV